MRKRRCLSSFGSICLVVAASLLLAAGAAAQTVGMVADDATDSVTVFDADSYGVLGSIPLAEGDIGDCAVTPDQTLGLVTDFRSQLWFVDLSTSPPSLAAGPNPVSISNPGEDVAISPDGRFAITCDAREDVPVSVVDIATRTEVSTLPLDIACNAVDVCSDGSVLVASFSPGEVRRLTLDDDGMLAETGESLSINFLLNVYCGPTSSSGVAVRFSPGKLYSFTIPGLVEVDERPITNTGGVNGGINAAGSRVFARSANGDITVYAYDEASGSIGETPLLGIPAEGAVPYFGIDQAALHPDDVSLFVTETGVVNVYDLETGVLQGAVTAPEIVAPTGVCLGAASCGDGNTSSGEVCDDGELNGVGDGYCLDDCSAVQVCGDGVVVGTEQCDDGGESPFCNLDCTPAACGDAVVNTSAGEKCDEGPANSDVAANACRSDCVLPMCGDEVVDAGETCDGGSGEICNNGIDDDGNGRIDCADEGCPSVCAHDASLQCGAHAECRVAYAGKPWQTSCVGAESCDGGCHAVTTCTVGQSVSGAIKLASGARTNDRFTFHAFFATDGIERPYEHDFAVLVSDEGGVVYTAQVDAHDVRPAPRGAMYRAGGRRGGRSSEEGLVHVRIRSAGRRARHVYVIDLEARGDLSALTSPALTVQIRLGEQTMVVREPWRAVPTGWKLR